MMGEQLLFSATMAAVRYIDRYIDQIPADDPLREELELGELDREKATSLYANRLVWFYSRRLDLEGPIADLDRIWHDGGDR
jgi:hypothetical protein